MPNMAKNKVKMPELDPGERVKNFAEVEGGYTPEMAMEEAERCLNCRHRPCVSGCPVNVKIPEFLTLAAKGEFEAAYQKIKETNSLPAVCGRVCPQESQCEAKCVRGVRGESVAIGRLERFVADWHIENSKGAPMAYPKDKEKVAVVGAGPAGLTCAGDLAKLGYDVTIFEAFHVAGGVLMYGIPQFRLPKEIVKKEIDDLKSMGVTIKTNMVIGKIFSVDDLLAKGFKAVFIGTGAGLPSFLGIPGENLNGVYSANEFLTRVNLMGAYEPDSDTPVFAGEAVAVVGGGNVAMDAARCARRLGSKDVYIVYRRSEAEMPARIEEVRHAKEEGIKLCILTNPVSIIGDEGGWVKAIKCVKMELGEEDASGRRRPAPVEGSEHELAVDTVIVAIGQTPNPLIKSTTEDIKTHKWGGIIVDEDTCATTKPGVYAGGDAVTGAATVILAAGAGKVAARAIDGYLRERSGSFGGA